nr:hypothetical protein AQUCO_02200002v1 [Tanacetum cinerariifolium]
AVGLEKGLTAVEGIGAVLALGVREEGLSAGEMLCCYANSSAGQLSWYGRTAAPREILFYTSSWTRFLNRTSIGKRCVGGGLKAGSAARRILGEINKNIINGLGAYPYGANSLQGY